VFHVALKIANQDEMPEWTPGDEFEAVRRQQGSNLRPTD